MVTSDWAHSTASTDYRLLRGTIDLAVYSEFHLSLPQTPQFEQANLTDDSADEQIRQTEGA